MADGSDLPVGEYSILPTEEPRKYVISVKLPPQVFNHLQHGTSTASICFGKENTIFTVDNEQYNFQVQHDDQKGECYYQSYDMFAEIGDVKQKLAFKRQLTEEDRNRIKANTVAAEQILKGNRVIVLGERDVKGKKGLTKTTKVTTLSVPKRTRMVVPAPRPSTPPPKQIPAPSTTTPPASSTLSPPPVTPSTPPMLSPPLVSPPQQHSQPQQKVLSPSLGSPPPTTPPQPPASTPRQRPTSRSRTTPQPAATTPPPPPVIKEAPPSKPPQKITLRMQLIHDLALAPKTPAKLAEKRKVSTEEVTQLLPTMAKYAPPGLWHPIPQIFKEVDVNWHEYSPEDRLIVAEKVKEALVKLASEPAPPVEDKSIAASTKNLKTIIPIDPSEKRAKPKPVNTPPLPSTSPTLDLSPPSNSSSESLLNKKRRADSSSSAPSKSAKLNPPIPPELLSPPPPLPAAANPPPPSTSSSSSSSTPAPTPSLSSPTPTPLPPSSSTTTSTTSTSTTSTTTITTTNAPIPTPTPTPTPTPIQKRPKPPPKPPSNPIPTPISNPSSSSSSFTSPKNSANKATPAPKPKATPTNKSVPPTKNTITPPKATPKTTPPSKPTPLPSKQHARNATNNNNNKTTIKNPATRAQVPPMRVTEVPTFHFAINSQQDNEKHRRVYHEKYVTYKELHQKLTENKEHFLKLDDEWKHADVDARGALSTKIESAYMERKAEVERMQEQHAALHGELSAIKDAMKKYADSVRARTQGNADSARAMRTQENANVAQRDPKRAKTESSPPLQQKRANNNNNNNNNNENNNNQPTSQKPAQRIPPRQPKPPSSQKQNTVATKS